MDIELLLKGFGAMTLASCLPHFLIRESISEHWKDHLREEFSYELEFLSSFSDKPDMIRSTEEQDDIENYREYLEYKKKLYKDKEFEHIFNYILESSEKQELRATQRKISNKLSRILNTGYYQV
ncbi:MAG: hypothetical protein AABW50_02340 [Nanoarchaeota archaeon]